MTTLLEELGKDLDIVSRAMLDLARRNITSRRNRVLVFAILARAALDELPVDQRGSGFVTRTWDLPVLPTHAQDASARISDMVNRFVSWHGERAILFSHATRMAADELSPDERSRALARATEIIGTLP